MVTLNDRERAFEAKFANDQEAKFKLTAMRNRLFAEWAAAKLGLVEAKKAAFIDEVIVSDLEEPGDADILGKVKADFDKAAIAITEGELSDQLAIAKGDAQASLLEQAS